jgi:hypothetical protein
VPAPEQRPSATVVPSDWAQLTLRVWVALEEHVFEEADQLPEVQEYVQVLVSLKVWERAPSVPHENVVGVQAWEVAGAVPVHSALATVVPSERVQVTVWVAEPEFALTTQVPVRVCGRFVPQPVVGVQEE